MGDAETLNGLLTYADRYVNQTWRDGGLTCPRNDQRFAAGGNPTLVSTAKLWSPLFFRRGRFVATQRFPVAFRSLVAGAALGGLA